MLILLHWNSGDIVLVQHEIHKKAKKSALDQKDTGTYESCVILRTPEDGSTGHKDVVQCIYHDVKVFGFSKVFEVLLISSLGYNSLLPSRTYSLLLSTVVQEMVFSQDGLSLRWDLVVIRRTSIRAMQCMRILLRVKKRPVRRKTTTWRSMKKNGMTQKSAKVPCLIVGKEGESKRDKQRQYRKNGCRFEA
jgi:hypothetical protein